MKQESTPPHTLLSWGQECWLNDVFHMLDLLDFFSSKSELGQNLSMRISKQLSLETNISVFFFLSLFFFFYQQVVW